MNCIQNTMRCSCIVKTPKNVSYHPSCKAVYWREGTPASFVKIGYRCPNCNKWYDLE